MIINQMRSILLKDALHLKQNKTAGQKFPAYKNNAGLMSYPADYYLSFGIDADTRLIEKMKKTEDAEERMKLFLQMTPKARKNAEALAERFKNEGLTVSGYVKTCIKQPILFSLSPDKLEANVKNLVLRFKDEGLNTQDYIKACIKSPQLFYQSPDTLEANVRNLVLKFKDEGLNIQDYLKACIKQPSLLHQSPDTVEKNVRNLTAGFAKDGLDIQNYLKACIKCPSLFCQQPETLEANVRNLVLKFKDEGLNTQDYIKACIKQPPLFYQSPDTIEKNVRNLAAKFKNDGLDLQNYLQACIKCPSLFCQQPETIAEHIDVMRFGILNSKQQHSIKDIFNKPASYRVDLTYSSSLLMLKYLIIPKIFEGSEIPKNLKRVYLKENFAQYLKEHPKENYTLNVKGAEKYIELLKKAAAEISDRKDRFIINHIKEGNN